jgi:hypothetical protein
MFSNKKYTLDNVVLPTKRRNINPAFWGPQLWLYLHTAAACYPLYPNEQEINDMVAWIKTLPVTLPCDSCKMHFKEYIEQNEDQLKTICSSQTALFQFFVDIHNKVNNRNGKRSITYEEARQMYFL